MPETLLAPAWCLALSAALCDTQLRKTLDPSVSSHTLFAYKMSHPYPTLTARSCGHLSVGEEYSIATPVPLPRSRIQAPRSIPPSPKINGSEDPQVTQDWQSGPAYAHGSALGEQQAL